MIEAGSAPTTFKLAVDHSEYTSGLQLAAKSTGDFRESLEAASTGVDTLASGIGSATDTTKGLVASFATLDDIALFKANSPFNKLASEASTAGEAADELAAATEKMWVRIGLGKRAQEVEKLEQHLGDFYDKASKVVGKDSLIEKFEEFVQQFKPQKFIGTINLGLTTLTKNLKGISPEMDMLVEKIEQAQKLLSKAEFGLNVITTLENIEDGIQNVKEGVGEAIGTVGEIVPVVGAGAQAFAGLNNVMMQTQIAATGVSFVTTGSLKAITAGIRDLPIFEFTALIGGLAAIKDQLVDLDRVQKDFYRGLETMTTSGADTSLTELSLSMGVLGEKMLFNIDATKQYVSVSTQLWQELEAGIMQIRTLSAAATTSVNEWSEAIQDTVNGELQNAVTSTQIIGNIYQAVSAGAKTVELALQQVSVAAKVANATGSNLETVQQALVFTANATNQSLDQVGDIAAKLKVTVDEAILSMEELGNIASSNLASITSLGFKFEETLADIARASQTLGYDSGIAVQRLAQSLSSLTPESEKVAKEYGLNIGKMIKDGESLTGIMHKINKAVGGNINVIRDMIPETIAFKGAVALLNTSLDSHGKTLENIKAANEQQVDELFAESQETIQNRAKSMANGMREYFTEAGRSFTESGIFEAGISALEEFLKLLQNAPPWMKNMIGGIVMMNLALEKFMQILMGVVGIIGTLIATVIAFRFPAILGGIKNAVLNLNSLGKSATFAQKAAYVFNKTLERFLGIETELLPMASKLNEQWKVGQTLNESWIGSLHNRVKAEWAKVAVIWKGTEAEVANTAAVQSGVVAENTGIASTIKNMAMRVKSIFVTNAETASIQANTAAKGQNTAATVTDTAAGAANNATGIVRIATDMFGNIQHFMGRLMEAGTSLFSLLGAGFVKLAAAVAPFIAALGVALAAGIALVAIGTILYDIGKALDLTGSKARKLARDLKEVELANTAANAKIKETETKTGEALVRHQTLVGSWIVGNMERAAEFINMIRTMTENIPYVGKALLFLFNLWFNKFGLLLQGLKFVTGFLEGVVGKIPIIGGFLENIMGKLHTLFKALTLDMGVVRTLFADITLALNYLANGKDTEARINGIGKAALSTLTASTKLRKELQAGNVDTEASLKIQKDMIKALEEEQTALQKSGKDPKRLEEVSSALADQIKLTGELGEKAKEIEAIEKRKLDLSRQNLSLTAEEIAKKKQLSLEVLQTQIDAQKAQAASYLERANTTKNDQEAAALRQNAKLISEETAKLELQVKVMLDRLEAQELYFKQLREGGRSSTEAIDQSVSQLDKDITKAQESLKGLNESQQEGLTHNINTVDTGRNIIDSMKNSVEGLDSELAKLSQRDFNSAITSFQELNQAILSLNSQKDDKGNILPFEPEEIQGKVMSTLDSLGGLIASGRQDTAREMLEFITTETVAVVDDVKGILHRTSMELLTPEQMLAVVEGFRTVIEAELEQVKINTENTISQIQADIEIGNKGKIEGIEEIQAANKTMRDAEFKASQENLDMLKEFYGENHKLFKDALLQHELLIKEQKAAAIEDARAMLQAQHEEFLRLQEMAETNLELLVLKGRKTIETLEKESLENAAEASEARLKMLQKELEMYEKGSEKYNEILLQIAKEQVNIMKAQIELQVYELNKAIKNIQVDQAISDAQSKTVEKANSLILRQLDLQNKARETAVSLERTKGEMLIREIEHRQKMSNDNVAKAEMEFEKIIAQEKIKRAEIEASVEAQKVALERADLELEMGKNTLQVQKITLGNQIKSLEIEIQIAKVKKTVGAQDIQLMNLRLDGLKEELFFLDKEAELLEKNNKLTREQVEAELERLQMEEEFISKDSQLAIKEAANNILITQQEKLLSIKQLEITVMEHNQAQAEELMKTYEQSLQRQTEIINNRQQLANSFMDSIRNSSKLLVDLSASEGVKAKREREARDRELKFLKIKQEMELAVFKMQERQQQMALKRQEIEAKIAVNRAKMEAMSAELEAKKVLMNQNATQEEKQMALLQAEMAKSAISSQEQNLALIMEQASQYESMAAFREAMFKNQQKNEEFQVRSDSLDPNGDFEARRQLRNELDIFLKDNDRKLTDLKGQFEDFGLGDSAITQLTLPIDKIDNILTQDISVVLKGIDQTIRMSTENLTKELNNIIQRNTQQTASTLTQNQNMPRMIQMEVNSPVTVDASGSREDIIREARNHISRDMNNTFEEVGRRLVAAM